MFSFRGICWESWNWPFNLDSIRMFSTFDIISGLDVCFLMPSIRIDNNLQKRSENLIVQNAANALNTILGSSNQKRMLVFHYNFIVLGTNGWEQRSYTCLLVVQNANDSKLLLLFIIIIFIIMTKQLGVQLTS